LSTRASLELVRVGQNGEATARATWSPKRGEGEVEHTRERGVGRVSSVRPNRYAGFDHFGLTSRPRGILVFLELVKMQ
jgi:hypothetical protein